MEVTLQFGLCSAHDSDFAPSSPIRLWPRLFKAASVHSRVQIIFNKRNPRNLSHFAIWTLQCSCECLCAFVIDLIIIETVHKEYCQFTLVRDNT